jgi:hypothetical protein
MTVIESGARCLVVGKRREANGLHPLVIDKGAVASMPHFPPAKFSVGASNPIPTPTPSTRPHMFSRRSSLPEPRTRPLQRHSVRKMVPPHTVVHGLPQYFPHSGYLLVHFANRWLVSARPSTPPPYRTSVDWPGWNPRATSDLHVPSTVPAQLGKPANVGLLLNRPGSREFPRPTTGSDNPRLSRGFYSRHPDGYVSIFRGQQPCHQSPKSSPCRRRVPRKQPPIHSWLPRQAATARPLYIRQPSHPRGGHPDPGFRHSHPSRFPNKALQVSDY